MTERQGPDPARLDEQMSAVAAGPVPRGLLLEVQKKIAQTSKAKPDTKRFAYPNECSGYFYTKQDDTIAYTFGVGTGVEGVVEQPPATAIAQYHSHPPKFGSDLTGPGNIVQNYASFQDGMRPGDVQRWIAPDGIRARGILHAYVFGPTQVAYYDLTKLTGALHDERTHCVAVLSGNDVKWPFMNDYPGANIA
jgi:hypothetical protein